MGKMSSENNNHSFRNWPVLLLAVLLVGAMCIGIVRHCQPKLFPVSSPMLADPKDAEEWIRSVRKGDSSKALLLAEKFVASDAVAVPDPDYIKVVADMGLGTLVLTEKFNRYDFAQWQDMFEIKDLVSNRKSDQEITPDAIFKRVFSKVEYRKSEPGYVPSPSVMEVWRRGHGNSHEIARLLCALGYQAGYEMQAVSLLDETGNFTHLLCEFRKGSSSAVIDPRYMMLWSGFSAADLADPKNSDQLKGWSGPAECLKKRLYSLPAEVMDYRICNQNLYKTMKPFDTKGAIPVFGMDPRGRIDDYAKKYVKDSFTGNLTYWRYPFHLLSSQPDFPADWRLSKEQDVQK